MTREIDLTGANIIDGEFTGIRLRIDDRVDGKPRVHELTAYFKYGKTTAELLDADLEELADFLGVVLL